MWSKKEADTSIRGLPFYIKRETFIRADARQRMACILSVILVISMLCIIFQFSAADATQSSNLSEGFCIRIVREASSLFPEQFPKEKLIKVAAAIEYPIRKCAHFTEYAILGITVNLYLWMCYYLELFSDNREKATKEQQTKGRRLEVYNKALAQEAKGSESGARISMWDFLIRAELFCALYACSDELHQYFVPGRSCRFFDVCVDSAGAFCGTLLFWGFFHLRERKRREIPKKSKS